MEQNGRCALDILSLESGETKNLIDFNNDDFAQKVEEHLAFNESWIAIPLQQNVVILDVQTSQIKYLEKKNGTKFFCKLTNRVNFVLCNTE